MYVCMYVFIKLHITTQSGPKCMYVCMYVCIFIKLHITAQSESFYATRIDPPKGVCMYVCVYVFIKLHITTQSGPVILVILCHSH